MEFGSMWDVPPGDYDDEEDEEFEFKPREYSDAELDEIEEDYERCGNERMGW